MDKFLGKILKPLEKAKNRFPVTMIMMFLIFLSVATYIIVEPRDNFEEFLVRSAVGLSFGVLVNIFFVVLHERCKSLPGLFSGLIRNFKLINLGLTVITVLLVSFIYNATNDYVLSALTGLSVVLFFGTVYILALKGDISKIFTHVYKVLHVNTFILGLLSAGVGLLVYAFNALVFEYDGLETLFFVLMAFIWIVIWTSMLLGNIPEEEEEIITPKLIYILFGLVCLPVFLGLLGILYMYLIRVIVSGFDGNMSWYTSAASLMFIFLYFILEQYKAEKKQVHLFIKFGGFLIIPLILLQFFSMGTRVYYHGFTEARYACLWLNGIALLVAGLSLIKEGKYIKQSFLAVMGVAFIVSTGPLNLLDVPLRDQVGRLQKVLIANGMWVDQKVIPKESISDADKAAITAAMEYITYTARREDDPRRKRVPKAFLVDRYKNTEFYDTFGFSKVNLWQYAKGTIEFQELRADVKYVNWYNGSSLQVLDLDNFSSIALNVTEKSDIGNGDVWVYDLKIGNIQEYVKGLYEEYGNYIPSDVALYVEFDKGKVIFQNLSFDIVQEIGSTEPEFRNIRFNAHVLK